MKEFKQWEGFSGRLWKEGIDVRDFIQKNYKPYDGDESFLAGPTEATDKLWGKLQELQKEERKKGGVLDMETEVVSSLTSYGPGYISEDLKNLEKVVGLQTDKPLKRAFMPYGGIRMAEQSCTMYGYQPSEKLHEIFTKYHKTHSDAVFEVYTPEMKRMRHNKILTGLPDTYGRGRIVGDYRRVALYGIDALIEEKENDFAGSERRSMRSKDYRIREEIADGKSVATAIETGFARARSAILDGNITTLIAAAVLGLRGSGTVKGFASTLAIGIILSMFTCMVVTKVLMHAVYAIGVRDAKFYGKAKERKPFDFVGKTGIFIAISCAIIVCGCVGVGMHKSSDGTILNYSLEFKGGTSTAVVMDKQYSIKEIDKEIVPLVEKITGDGNVQAQAVEGTKQIIIKTRTLSLEERTKLEKTMTKNFGVDKKDITSESISSTVSNEMKTDAIVAVVIATICMLLYIWFRFKDVRFAGSAVIALSHDVIMVFICYVLAWISVGNTFIACMLTIIGYSINNTIVIFDRIRDALKKHHAQTKAAYKEIVNKSIAQTMSRSVNTSITTFVMVLVLYIMGVTSIREFALPLMVGLLAGTYSSICLASEIWYLLRTKGMKKE